MYRKLVTTIIFIGTLGFAETSFACREADVPQLPNADTAVLAEMVKAQKEVKKYLEDSEAFLKCVRDDHRHNLVVDQMKDVADRFNSLTRAYKARVNG